MRIRVYLWGSGELQEQEVPIPMIGDTPSKGELYRLRDGILQEKLGMSSMNLIEFMEVYPDAICKKIVTSTKSTVYQFESPKHGVAIYLQHNTPEG